MLIQVQAWYDADKYPLKKHNGKLENLMGNMRVYIGGETVPGAGGFLSMLGLG
jgi:hypothetical protein